MLNKTINDYIDWLEINLKNVDYYPRTRKMKQALLDAVNIRFEIFSNQNFDDLFEKYTKKYIYEVKNLLVLDEDSRHEMEWLRKEG